MPDQSDRVGCRKLLWLSFKSQAVFLWLATGFLLAQGALAVVRPHMAIASSDAVADVVVSTLVSLALALVCYKFFEMLLYRRPRHPVPYIAAELLRTVSRIRTMALGWPVYVSLIIIAYAFNNVKANITVLQPFSWDQTLDRWDTLLHFGHRPWEWLQPLLGYWPVTFVLNINYNIWFILMFGVWMHHAFLSPPGVARTRFVLGFMLVWMIEGSIFAVLFSSAGPCFFGAGRLGLSPDPYQGLMDYLRAADQIVPVWALSAQDILWSMHRAGSADGSISAMPSLHNGTALLFALSSTGWPGWLRRLLWLNVPLIFLGSIHLGWHYAVDGYVAWALTLVIWWAADPLARRCESRPVAVRFRRAFAQSPASL